MYLNDTMSANNNAVNTANSTSSTASTSSQSNVDTLTGNTTSSTNSTSAGNDTKLDWKQQKEQQALERKRQNEIKKIEDEISACETRNDEIDQLLTLEEIYTDVPKLMELNNEKKSIEDKLEELLERWEEVSM